MKRYAIISLALLAVVCVSFAATGDAQAGIHGRLHVQNNSFNHLEIFYNGRYIGCVGPYGCEQLYVGDPSTRCFELRAYKSYYGHRIPAASKHGTGCRHNDQWTIGCRHHRH